MKESKQCPKCSSLKIGYAESGLTVPPCNGSLGDHVQWDKSLGARRCSYPAELYVCADCGYFEQYLAVSAEMINMKELNLEWLNPEHTQEGPYR
jgi:hypothetical protein